MGFVASLWVRTSSRLVCGVMVNTSKVRRGTDTCPVSCRSSWRRWPTERIPWRKSDSKPFDTNTIWPLPRRGRDTPRWCLVPAVAPDDHRPHYRVGRAGPDRGQDHCPRRECGGTLARWGYGRRRRIRGLGADAIDVRPRRVRCGGCGATQVLLPAALQPRRADATEVIGTALARKAAGLGHRRIAAALGRSPSTVRRWLRRARGRGHLTSLAVSAGANVKAVQRMLGPARQ